MNDKQLREAVRKIVLANWHVDRTTNIPEEDIDQLVSLITERERLARVEGLNFTRSMLLRPDMYSSNREELCKNVIEAIDGHIIALSQPRSNEG